MKDKRKGKLDRHFSILVNGHTAKILSYRIQSIDGREHLILKTLIRSQGLDSVVPGRTRRISIGTEDALQDLRCYCYCGSGGPSPWTYYFYILKEGETVSYGEIISPEPNIPAENS